MPKDTAFPLAFLARMAALLDDEFPAFLVALSQRHRVGLRVNTLKITPSQLLELTPWELTPVPWCPEGFVLPGSTNAGQYPLHDAGLYYIQEPSTMAVAMLLAPQPGERVLDLCAAPGGKSTHLAALMAGHSNDSSRQVTSRGLLVSNEIDRDRATVLVRNLERWGTRHALVLSETPERLARRWPAAFDRVLVDAPCSGEGMFRKNLEARHHWSEAHVAGCALRQSDILDAAARLVRPGGWLAYATCTFAPEENEGVVLRFLQQYPDFELVEPAWYPGFEAGRPEWAAWPETPGDGHGAHASSPQAEEARRDTAMPYAMSHQERGREAGEGLATINLAPELADSLRRTVRLWPHKLEGEGHFVAVMRRAGDALPAEWPRAGPTALAAGDQAAIEAFWRPLIDEPWPERLLLRPRDRITAEVYALQHDDTPDVTGLRSPRPGWHLGTLRKGRFIPSHALALGLRAEAVSLRVDESVGSEFIARYLRGETLHVSGPDGWLLITVAGFPLGWGKRSRGVIKNHYPKNRRWL